MKIAFTICSNNYLAYAKVLGNSLKSHEPDTPFYIFLCDEKKAEIDYTGLANEVIALAEIEPQFYTLASKYNIIELNTALKPRVFQYLFNERKFSKALYFDPDIKIYNSIDNLFHQLEISSIILTPHICSPIPLDGKTPAENHFLNFGIYNLGFIGLKKNEETGNFLNWWKGHTYTQGYIDVYKGIFVDQLPINFAPIFFGYVSVVDNRGCNMGPWNLHERYLSINENVIMVNKKEPLIFFHFSSFKPGEIELPLSQYNRFTLSSRRDLQRLYKQYNDELTAADYFFYQKFTYAYAGFREAYLKQMKKEKWKNKLLLKKSSKK